LRSLVLASTSPFRGELLGRLGIPFIQADPGIDEDPWKARGLPPERLVLALARAKAEALAAEHPRALILGADQAVDLDGEALGKPGSHDAAVEQLLRLQGRSHRLLTGVALHDAAARRTDVALDEHAVTLRPLRRPQVEGYVCREDVRACAGAYRVEGLGIALFESVLGRDWTGIVGLPLLLVTRMLAEAGLDPLDPRHSPGPADPDPRR
jgi:MAF protein